MNNNIDRAFWAQRTAQLPNLVSGHYSYTDFTIALLRDLATNLELKRATYLTCIPEKDTDEYEVTGESFPTDRWIEPRKSSEVKLLAHDIILKDSNERYLEKVLTVSEDSQLVKAFQVCLPRYETQHILVLSGPVTQSAQISEDDKRAAFEYIHLFTHLATGMYLDKVEVIEFMRTNFR
ncbi:MAG: hypothetical protein ACYSSI_01430 [Planctomycetota bacterium]|jgi:hypothetical protein